MPFEDLTESRTRYSRAANLGYINPVPGRNLGVRQASLSRDGPAHPQPVDVRAATSRHHFAFRMWALDAAGTCARGQCCDDPVSPRSVGAGRCAAAPLEGSGCATRTAASAPLSPLSMLPEVICHWRSECRLWVNSGCAGQAAARQVNPNKRTPELEQTYLAIRHPLAG